MPLVHECVDSRNWQKCPRLVCKLDFEKAYDMVDWGFIQYMMGRMGFRHKWCKWINSYLSLIHFPVLVNGSLKAYFQSSRGLRRGDPLSPMHFVIVAEALNILMERANQLRLITCLSWDNATLEATHLQFADDAVIFCDANLVLVDNLKHILKWFELLSGLKINNDKCEFVGVHLEQSQLASLAKKFGCEIGKLPTKYLGLRSCLGLPKKSIWDPVV